MTEDDAHSIAEKTREDEWRARYAAHIKAQTGCTDLFAQECAAQVEFNTFLSLDDSPEDAADDEMMEWTYDG